MRASIWLLALGLVLGPLVVGFLLGDILRSLRRGTPPPRPIGVGILLLGPLAAAMVGTQIRMGVWDAVSIGLLAALGFVGGLYGWQRRRGQLALAALSFGLTLALAEWLVRTTIPPAPGFPAIEGATLFIPRLELEHPTPARGDFTQFHRQAVDGCALLFPERYPVYVTERAGRARPAAGSVIYLGDSMTYGLGVQLEHAFPAELEARTPGLHHINLAFPGTSVDYHYVIARHWLDHVPPPIELAVIGLYFNDLLEIGQGMPCCEDRSLLVLGQGGVSERCPTPRWIPGYGESVAWFLRNSPPPYPLRVTMEYSHFARYVDALLVQRASEVGNTDRPPEGEVWDRMREILAGLRDLLAARHISLVAVVLPLRAALEADDPASVRGYAESQQLKALAESVGIPTFDPWDHFRPLVQRDGSGRYFLGDHDIHFALDGHREMASWLLDTVPQLRAAAAPSVPPPGERFTESPARTAAPR